MNLTWRTENQIFFTAARQKLTTSENDDIVIVSKMFHQAIAPCLLPPKIQELESMVTT